MSGAHKIIVAARSVPHYLLMKNALAPEATLPTPEETYTDRPWSNDLERWREGLRLV